MEANNTLMRRFHVTGLRRLLVVNFLAVLGVAFLASLILAILATVLANLYPIPLSRAGKVIESIETLIAFPLLPCIFLLIAALVFMRRVMQRLNEPVRELMRAVESIRQHDLTFQIHYNKADELGDLCRAFNELQRELRASLEREWRKQEELREAMEMLSHDLRTPVTIIQGYIENLSQTPETRRAERLKVYLPILESSSLSMSRLLNAMLLVTTLEQTNFIPRPLPVLLGQDLARKAASYAFQAQERGVQFSYTVQAHVDLDAVLAIDIYHLEQVLDNLFSNALRFTPTDGHISLYCTWDEQHLEMMIQDTGCGIAQADLPHIFNKFYQSKNAQTKRNTSTGLGLYICKMLVEKQGGMIEARNCSTGGCEIAFRLPITRVMALNEPIPK